MSSDKLYDMNYFPHKSLEYLASQLALNHFYGTSLDICNNRKSKFKIEEAKLREDVFTKKLNRIQTPEGVKDHLGKTRNILVIGAGASQNAFSDLYLASDAQEEIEKRIIITDQIIHPKRRRKNSGEPIKESLNLNYFLKFYKCWHGIDSNTREEAKKSKNLNVINKELSSELDNKTLNDHIIRELWNENSYLNSLGQKYYSEVRKARLMKSEYDKEQAIDFETSLSILAEIIPLSQVRDAIQKLYQCSNGPTLFYHLVAHLLKHRFIDAIINFNFDELLDEILDEEIGANSYDKVLSDGDCKPLKDLVKDGRLRQPLYIKPHGTASHKSSLRFTKDQYHELPSDMRIMITDFLKTSSEKPKKKINLITVGFELKSIEFNEILSETLNADSQIFNFFYHNKDDDDLFEVDIRKKEDLFDIFVPSHERHKQSKDHLLDTYCPRYVGIPHESHIPEDGELEISRDFHSKDFYNSLDTIFLSLFDQISQFFNNEFKPRGIYRHLIISKIFGNKLFRCVANNYDLKGRSFSDFNKIKLPSYFHRSDYYKDRVLIEVLIIAATNHGKVNSFSLMDGYVGLLYSKYYELSTEEKKKPKTFNELLNSLDFFPRNPQNKFSTRFLPRLNEKSEDIQTVIDKVVDYYLQSKKGFSVTLKKYFSHMTDDTFQQGAICVQGLKSAFRNLFFSDNAKIKSEYRSARYHIFEKYSVVDLLPTELSINATYYLAITKHRLTHIAVVADYGLRVAKFLPLIKENNPQAIVFLIAQENRKGKSKSSTDENSELYKAQMQITRHNFEQVDSDFFKDKNNDEWIKNHLRILYSPVEQHNHHMTIFASMDNGKFTQKSVNDDFQAIYYYKWGLSQEIDPVYLNEPSNIKFVLNLFKSQVEELSKNNRIETKENWNCWL
ncbi:hypothetical protein GBO34_12090 [Roseivirga pacifica]|nr:hypothetical protein [Roseivirga pacifica]MCO6365206.1 hypothetical protein [Roseivirga pacifica]MCO6372064.1 hypothetical protein [Roseivirga pacifica]MCO6375825.1 hypothetical protein [Roseivirga pacifica]MCO6379442.1 hypothetical protein [Roseivirga pacifica]